MVDAVGASVEQVRERLASAEDQARIAAEQAGHRVAEEPGQEDLTELEAELAAAGAMGDGEVGTRDVTSIATADSSDAAAEASEAEGPGGEGAPADGEIPGEGGPGQPSSASRRSVDELFARIRASRAAEEAAAAAALAALEGPASSETTKAAPAASAAASTVAGEGIYDFDAVTAQGGDVLDERSDAPKAEEAATDALAATENAETAEIAEIAEIVEMAEIAEIAEMAEIAAVAEVAAGADGAKRADAITEPDVEALARRDHLLGPVTAKLGRALKRALQDDQNDLLNALRQASGPLVLDELAPSNLQRERFLAAATDQLAAAFSAGADFLVAGDTVEGPSVTAATPSGMAAFEAGALIAATLADDLSSYLRPRIELALSELDGSSEGAADAAGVAYREWKGTRVEGLAGDFTTRAFAMGELAVLSSLGPGDAPLVRWVVEDDDAGGSCPDCDDNSLAGPQPLGAEFPTGHVHPPAHPGCRCLLVPVRS